MVMQIKLVVVVEKYLTWQLNLRSWKKWKGRGKSGKVMEKVERPWKKWKGHGKSGKAMEKVERSWKKWKGHGKSGKVMEKVMESHELEELKRVRTLFFALAPTFSTNSRGNACYADYNTT